MGFQTDLFCNITFNRETYNNKSEVEDRIEEVNEWIQCAKNELLSLVVMTEPNKFCPEDYDALTWITQECKELMSSIEEYSVKLYKLKKLLDNWENCHNEKGLAINPPEEVHWNTAYLDGDFVRSVKYPNE